MSSKARNTCTVNAIDRNHDDGSHGSMHNALHGRELSCMPLKSSRPRLVVGCSLAYRVFVCFSLCFPKMHVTQQ